MVLQRKLEYIPQPQRDMPICPHCKKDFRAKSIEKDMIEGVADGTNMLGKVTYSCPNCHYFLAVGDVTPEQMNFGGP